MSTNISPVMTLEALRSVPLFASLDDAATSELRNLLVVREVAGGTPLFRTGDKGDGMYLIEKGRVRIHIHDADGSEVTLAELAGGDFFGEMALLDGMPRSADATVVEDARFAILSRENFLAFVRANPDIALKMLSAITHRLRRTDELLRNRVSRNANEEEAARLTVGDRLANRIAGFGGSWFFIGVLVVVLALWIYLNTWLIPQEQVDPYPYQLFGLILGVIAGIQAPIIMMSQNRQGEKDRLRADLDYQVNLKNELSLAEIMRRLDVLESERLPVLFEEQNRRIEKRIQNPESRMDKAANRFSFILDSDSWLLYSAFLMIQAIFLDFNGVVIDDEPIQMKAYQEALRAEGIALTEEEYYGALGMDDRTFVRAAFERAGKSLKDEATNALIERKTEIHRKLIEGELPLFPGVMTFIKAASRHYALGLASMARRIEIDHVLERARLRGAFTVIVSAEDAHACKPDPCCYERALGLLNERRRQERKLPLLPKECLVIEDAPPGIQAGKAAGMKTLGVTNTVGEDALRAAGADVVTHSLADWTVDAVHHVFD